MRLNKKLTVILTTISAVSFTLALFLNYFSAYYEKDFWANVLLGIFSGAFLTTITSIISYQHDKRKTLENFYCHTLQLLSLLSKYQDDMTIEEKLHFYINYTDFDKNAWNSDYGEIEFFFDPNHQKRSYIYNSIYTPLYNFGCAVERYYWNFQWYLKGTNRNEAAIKSSLDELELYLIEKGIKKIPREYDTSGKIISTCEMSFIKPKLTIDIQQELYGYYYEIMYGRKSKENTMEDNHGQP